MAVESGEGRALDVTGLPATVRLRWNLGAAHLYEAALARGEAALAAEGPLVARTGQHTGRAPNDKFIVGEPSSQDQIDWGSVNRPMDPTQFDVLHRDLMRHVAGSELF